MNITIEKEFRFEASHVLPKHEGKCARLHGHSWVLRVAVTGPVDPESGFVVDYAKLKLCVDHAIIQHLDHAHLGYGSAVHSSAHEVEMPEVGEPYFGRYFYPSSENLVVAIARILKPLIPELKPNVRLHQVSLDETCTSRAIWTADAT